MAGGEVVDVVVGVVVVVGAVVVVVVGAAVVVVDVEVVELVVDASGTVVSASVSDDPQAVATNATTAMTSRCFLMPLQRVPEYHSRASSHHCERNLERTYKLRFRQS